MNTGNFLNDRCLTYSFPSMPARRWWTRSTHGKSRRNSRTSVGLLSGTHVVGVSLTSFPMSHPISVQFIKLIYEYFHGSTFRIHQTLKKRRRVKESGGTMVRIPVVKRAVMSPNRNVRGRVGTQVGPVTRLRVGLQATKGRWVPRTQPLSLVMQQLAKCQSQTKVLKPLCCHVCPGSLIPASRPNLVADDAFKNECYPNLFTKVFRKR